MTMPKGLKLVLLIAAALGAGLCGCVAYPAYPYGGDYSYGNYGYYGGSAYYPYDDGDDGYAAPFYGGVFIGGEHYDHDWHDGDDRR